MTAPRAAMVTPVVTSGAMRARLLDGSAVARAMRGELAEEAAALARAGRRPGLGVLLVGDDPASAVYVRSKTRACDELGLFHETRRLPASAATDEVLAEVLAFNRRPDRRAMYRGFASPRRSCFFTARTYAPLAHH